MLDERLGAVLAELMYVEPHGLHSDQRSRRLMLAPSLADAMVLPKWSTQIEKVVSYRVQVIHLHLHRHRHRHRDLMFPSLSWSRKGARVVNGRMSTSGGFRDQAGK